jgi:hypothetical protein
MMHAATMDRSDHSTAEGKPAIADTQWIRGCGLLEVASATANG